MPDGILRLAHTELAVTNIAAGAQQAMRGECQRHSPVEPPATGGAATPAGGSSFAVENASGILRLAHTRLAVTTMATGARRASSVFQPQNLVRLQFQGDAVAVVHAWIDVIAADEVVKALLIRQVNLVIGE